MVRDERQRLNASREDQHLHRPYHVFPSWIPSTCDSRPRLIRPRRPLSRASREMPTLKGTRHNMEFLSSATAEEHSPQRRSTVVTSGNVESARLQIENEKTAAECKERQKDDIPSTCVHAPKDERLQASRSSASRHRDGVESRSAGKQSKRT